MAKTLPGFVGVLLLVLSAFGIPTSLAASALRFSGEVTYLDRMALPPDAALRVTLVDLSGPVGANIVAATAPIASVGNVPLLFELSVQSDVIVPGGQYGLVAEIGTSDRVWFASPEPVAVDIASTDGLILLVDRVAPEAEIAIIDPMAPNMEVDLGLFDTLWAVQAIAGQAIAPETQVTLSIAMDRRAGGNGGCNHYFTEAVFDGDQLSFGAPVATKMACAPNVMGQEAALFAALASTASYRRTSKNLLLLDSEGDALVTLIPADQSTLPTLSR